MHAIRAKIFAVFLIAKFPNTITESKKKNQITKKQKVWLW